MEMLKGEFCCKGKHCFCWNLRNYGACEIRSSHSSDSEHYCLQRYDSVSSSPSSSVLKEFYWYAIYVQCSIIV